MVVMVVVAVTLGFFIGGGPSLLTDRGSGDDVALVATGSSTSTTSTTTSAPGTTTTAGPSTPRPPGEVAVRVHNGSRTSGQAVRVGDRLQAAGYKVLPPGPSREPADASTVQFAAGYEADAEALASLLGLPSSVVPVAADTGEANVVVFVGDDLRVDG